MADVKQREFVIDKLCDNISKYLIDLCMLHLSDKDNEMVTSLLNTVSDMERVGDHAENIVELAEEMKQEGISFSDTALEELNEMSTTTLGGIRQCGEGVGAGRYHLCRKDLLLRGSG